MTKRLGGFRRKTRSKLRKTPRTKGKIKLSEVENFKAIPGKGVEATLNRVKILFGTRKLMKENKISVGFVEEKMIALEEQGKTAMILAVNKKVIGIVAVADVLKEKSG